jgi:hypothetical protein
MIEERNEYRDAICLGGRETYWHTGMDQYGVCWLGVWKKDHDTLLLAHENKIQGKGF